MNRGLKMHGKEAPRLAEGAERWAGKIADLQEAQRLAEGDRR
jgi:hypothetical protein